MPLDSYSTVLFQEYFYKRLSELDEAQRELLYTMRTKKSILILCDKLRALEQEKLVLMRVYEDLRPFM